jgi:hypothetical protein
MSNVNEQINNVNKEQNNSQSTNQRFERNNNNVSKNINQRESGGGGGGDSNSALEFRHGKNSTQKRGNNNRSHHDQRHHDSTKQNRSNNRHHNHNARPSSNLSELKNAEISKGSRENLTSSSSSLTNISNNNRRKLMSISSNNGSVSCICCLHELHTYVYYQCSHYVCLNCAVKMRALCEKIDCPVCRQESKEVLCTRKPIDLTNINDLIKTSIEANKAIIHSSPQIDPKEIGIYFHEECIRNEYLELLANKCDICIKHSEQQQQSKPQTDGGSSSSSKISHEFNNFKDLESHMRKTHSKFYCELCLEHLKLFSHERKYYNREDLAIHKRRGDKDDYSFKGHPLCNYSLIFFFL